MWISSFPREVLYLYLRLPSVLTLPSSTDTPGQSPHTHLQSCTSPSWNRRQCWFSVKEQRQKGDQSHHTQTANCSQVQQGTPAPLLMFFPHSLRPKVQNEFSLSLQIDLGSMKTHFPPKLVFTRFFFFSFFADNCYSVRNRKKEHWNSVKERTVRVDQKNARWAG